MNIEAKWTGKWPCLCHGEWIITIDGVKVNLPEEVRTSDMGTYGCYRRWWFESNWEEAWDSYEDGLEFQPWVEENSSWLSNLHLSEEDLHALYDAISEEDWRHGSCGGCI